METMINGIKLHYIDRGEGQPILLIQRLSAGGCDVGAAALVLEEHYRVIIPDLRGFGESAVPAGPYLMDTFVDDLIALLDQLEIKRVVVVGLSMGGYIAMALVRRYPLRVHALVLADTRANPDDAAGKASRETNAQLAERAGATAIADQMVPRLLAPTAPENIQMRVRQIIERNNPQGIAAALRGMAQRPDSTGLLPEIRVPTLLLVGEQDALTTPETMAGMQRAIDGSQLVVVPGAGHLPNLEQSERFNTALFSFLQRVL
ncbi:MAG: alpha/beta fold hydrolase [Chloroflexaceae bacterium]|nr:alpha/beta fold hydrolase [Chloroflexaceae bacterium]